MDAASKILDDKAKLYRSEGEEYGFMVDNMTPAEIKRARRDPKFQEYVRDMMLSQACDFVLTIDAMTDDEKRAVLSVDKDFFTRVAVLKVDLLEILDIQENGSTYKQFLVPRRVSKLEGKMFPLSETLAQAEVELEKGAQE